MKGIVILKPIKDFSEGLSYLNSDSTDYQGDGIGVELFRLMIQYELHDINFTTRGDEYIEPVLEEVPLCSSCWEQAKSLIGQQVNFFLQYSDDEDVYTDGRKPETVAKF